MVLAELPEYVLGDGWSGTDVDIVLSDYALTHRGRCSSEIMRKVTDRDGLPTLSAVALSNTAIMPLLRSIRLDVVMVIAAISLLL
ncbi:MAG TPA: hypothetical protein EYQ82_08370 [Dehalococcoidia bacterium]|jgi:hypothetical protein|nr:hypothetical protein [Dehalococcoidia bacterium]